MDACIGGLFGVFIANDGIGWRMDAVLGPACMQALRNKAFGRCEDFCWSLENHYAVLEKGNRVKIYCNFEEANPKP